MTTVKTLIEQLQRLDPTEPVLFQYLVSDMVGHSKADFANIVDYLDDNPNFGEDSVELFIGWITEAADVLEEAEDEEE